MKKKLLVAVLAMSICFAVTACGDKESTEAVETTVETEGESTESVVEEESTEEAATEETTTEAETEAADVHVVVDIPEEFTEYEDGIYVSPDYPNDGSNVIIQSTEDTATGFPSEETLVLAFEQSLGEDADITIDKYETYTVDGYEALRVDISYVASDIECTQIQCMVHTDTETFAVGYTQASDEWADDFEESIQSIRVE